MTAPKVPMTPAEMVRAYRKVRTHGAADPRDSRHTKRRKKRGKRARFAGAKTSDLHTDDCESVWNLVIQLERQGKYARGSSARIANWLDLDRGKVRHELRMGLLKSRGERV